MAQQRIKTKPDINDKERHRRLKECEKMVCLLSCGEESGQQSFGTGWVAFSLYRRMALVTAGHVLRGHVREEGGGLVVDGEVTATFATSDVTVNLSGSECVMCKTVDVAVVWIENAPLLGAVPFRKLVLDVDHGQPNQLPTNERDGPFTLVHHPEAHKHVTFTQSVSLLEVTEEGVLHHTGASAGGSSGGLLLDKRCRAVAVHVGATGSGKEAIPLSLIHEELGDRSPWHGIAHESRQYAFCKHKLSQLPAFAVYRHVGGQDAVEVISGMLDAKQQVAVTGLPGSGKSVLALQFAHHHVAYQQYSVVAMLRAESKAQAEADMVALGVQLELDRPENVPMSEQAQRVKSRLNVNDSNCCGKVLLVFDNVDKYADVVDLLPSRAGCHCIFTANDASQMSGIEEVRLESFNENESLQLLNNVGRRVAEEEKESALALCAEVEHLPLAVAHLGAYAKTSGRSYDFVHRKLRDAVANDEATPRPLRRVFEQYRRGQAIQAALSMVYKSLDKHNLASLRQLSVLAPERVPMQVLGDGETDQLFDLAMVSYPEDGLVSTHRLVGLVARSRMNEGDEQRMVKVLHGVAATLNRLVSPTTFSSGMQVVGVWFPHAEALVARFKKQLADAVEKGEREHVAGLLNESLVQPELYLVFGQLCLAEMQLEWSRVLLHDCLVAMMESPEWGKDQVSPRWIWLQGALHFWFAKQLISEHNYADAEQLYEHLLAEQTRLGFKDQHLHVNTLHNLAGVKAHRGKQKEARKYYQEVARIHAQHPEATPDGLSVVRVEIGIASVEIRSSQFAAAARRIKDALRLADELAVPDLHPLRAVIHTLYGQVYFGFADNLSDGLVKQRALKRANRQLKRAVSLHEKVSHAHDPAYAAALTAQGDVFQSLGRNGEALDKYGQALEIARSNNDRKHAGKTLYRMARVHSRLSVGVQETLRAALAKAVKLYKQAEVELERALAAGHDSDAEVTLAVCRVYMAESLFYLDSREPMRGINEADEYARAALPVLRNYNRTEEVTVAERIMSQAEAARDASVVIML